jgi:hypothetical protein
MSLDTFVVQRPNALNQGADPLALAIEQYTGIVEGTIKRRSVLEGLVPMRSVKGTTTIQNFAVGESTLQKIVPGVTPNGTKSDASKASLTIDTVILARESLPLLDVFQTSYDARKEIGLEHGKKIGKFRDQVFFIQGAKASQGTESAYYQGSTGKPAGHFGGSLETLALAGDAADPAKLIAALARLLAKMELKDVDPRNDDVVLVCKPDVFYTLSQAETLINGEYITAEGNKLQNTAILKTYGVPVLSSNNYVGGETITSHLLSNAGNSNAYDGDFTKFVMTALSPRAFLAGETIPLTSAVFWDELSKSWYVDSHLAFGVSQNRREYAGSILIP